MAGTARQRIIRQAAGMFERATGTRALLTAEKVNKAEIYGQG